MGERGDGRLLTRLGNRLLPARNGAEIQPRKEIFVKAGTHPVSRKRLAESGARLQAQECLVREYYIPTSKTKC